MESNRTRRASARVFPSTGLERQQHPTRRGDPMESRRRRTVFRDRSRPYFDFPIPDGDDESLPLPSWPENTPDVVGRRDRNLRRRTYRGRLVHWRYSMELFTRADVESGRMPHLANDARLWARNQFVFWANHGKGPERAFLARRRERHEKSRRSRRSRRSRGKRELPRVHRLASRLS